MNFLSVANSAILNGSIKLASKLSVLANGLPGQVTVTDDGTASIDKVSSANKAYAFVSSFVPWAIGISIVGVAIASVVNFGLSALTQDPAKKKDYLKKGFAALAIAGLIGAVTALITFFYNTFK